MNTFMRKLWLSCLILLMIFLSNSCSMMGLVIGSGIDSANNPSQIEALDLPVLDKGESMRIQKNDQMIFEGTYQGIKVLPNENFGYFYREQKALLQTNLPEFGDSILVHNKAGKQIWYKFRGFNPDHIWIERINSDWTGLIKFDFIREIQDTDFNLIRINSLKSIADRGELFYDKKIILHVDNKEELIDPFDIDKIWIHRSDTYYTEILGSIGLALDISLIVIIVRSQQGRDKSKKNDKILNP